MPRSPRLPRRSPPGSPVPAGNPALVRPQRWRRPPALGCRRGAASGDAWAAGSAGGGRPRSGPGGGGEGPLRRLKLAVEEFVQGTTEGGTPWRPRARPSRGAGRARPAEEKPPGAEEGEAASEKGAPAPEGGRPRAGPPPGRGSQRPRAGAAREEADRLSAGPRAPRSAQGRPGLDPGPRRRAAAAARKRALLAANEEEDREIRKLERRLGLNKRRKKGDGSSAPCRSALPATGRLCPGAPGLGKVVACVTAA